MVLSKRERTIGLAMLAVVGVLVLDHFLVEPILDRFNQLRDDEIVLHKKLEHGRALIRDYKTTEARWNQMVADGMKSNAADAEDALDHAVYEWARDSRLTLKSDTPERTVGKVTSEAVLYVTGTGSMNAVAHFLYQVQTSKLPVKPEDIEVSSRKEGTDDLTLSMHISGLYFPADWKAAPAAPGAGGGNHQ